MAKRGVLPSDKVWKMNIKALVDTGAITLTINETLASQLDLDVQDRVDSSLADSSLTKCDQKGEQ